MQALNIFDMVIIGITLVLGLKGLFRGLVKEVFGIIGIIGAIFVASRVSSDVGELISPFLAINNQTTLNLIGFIIALIVFWVVVYLIGVIISKIFAASGLGVFDRFFGFVFGAAKIFMILSVIAYALYQVNSFKKAIDDRTQNSIVMPKLLGLGAYIIKLDTSTITDTIDSAVDKAKEMTNDDTKEKSIESTNNDLKQSAENLKEDIKKDVVEKVEENINKAVDSVNEQIDSTTEKLKETLDKAKE